MPASPKFVAWIGRPESRVAITGATGWLGRAMADFVLRAGLGADRLRLYGTAPRALRTARWSHPVEGLAEAAPLGEGDWLLLHLAVAGKDRVEGGDARQVRTMNDALLLQAKALAESGDARRIVFFSSGAAARRHEPGLSVDQRAYGEMKAAQEQDIADWAAASRRSLVMPRVFAMGGPFVTYPERYALSDMILSLTASGRIAIKADRPVLRSYVHVEDLARVVFDLGAGEGAGPRPFDVGGGEVVEMADLARVVAQTLGRPDAEIARPPLGAGAPDRYVGEGAAFLSALVQASGGLTPLARIIQDTAAYLQNAASAPPGE